MWLGVIVDGRCYYFPAKLIIVAKYKEKIDDQKRKRPRQSTQVLLVQTIC
jgi:hypothetical protein